MTVNYLKNQELHATDSVMDDRFKKISHWIYPFCFMFLEIPEVVQWLPAVRQCWEEAVGGPPSPAQTGWTEQHEKEGAGSLYGWTTEEPRQSKLSQGIFSLVKPLDAGFSFEFSKIAFCHLEKLRGLNGLGLF